jgi:ribonuclease HIII
MSGTLVVMLEEAAGERLYKELGRGAFQFKPMDHARWAASGEDVSVVWYRSGKLVVQGKGAGAFAERHRAILGEAARVEPSGARRPAVTTSGKPTVGSDESGKGDYFGPLVVAAVRLAPGDAEKLTAGGVMDSKLVSDAGALRTAAALRAHFPCALRVLDPPEYTRRQKEHGNVALLLAELYREAVEEVALPGCAVLIDQFSKSKDRLERAFRGLDVQLFQEHRGERAAAVAAASLVARAEFLLRLKELSDEIGYPLPKGAGPPVLKAGRELVRRHGPKILERVAKVHFKTTEQLLR